jgi:hypothetical protein
MPLSDIVNVQITRQTQSVSEAGFGTLMILGTFKNWNDRIRSYSNMDEVAADFSPFQKEYIAAQNVFSQPITTPLIMIGRRSVDEVGILVETALPAQTYTVTINDTDVTINSTSSVQESVVTLDAPLVASNLIAVELNGEQVGSIKSIIDFNIDFVASNSIVATVNGVALTPVVYATSHAATMTALAAALALATGVSSASVTAARTIRVNFSGLGDNTVDSVVTTLGASQPTATINEGGFLYATSNALTMGVIATAIETALNVGYSPGVATAVVSGDDDEIISITSNPNQAGEIDSFTVTLGASQAVATIEDTVQPTSANTIADALATAITASGEPVTASTPAIPDGTLTVVADVDDVPYTVAVSTSIVSPDKCRVMITQTVPNQAYTVKINGSTFTYTAPIDVTDDLQIAAGLVAEINTLYPLPPLVPVAKKQPVSATDNLDGSFEIEADVAGTGFTIKVASLESMTVEKGLIIDPYTASATVTADLTAIAAVNNDWYALASTTRDTPTVKLIAAWVEARVKLYGIASDNANIINVASGVDTTSIAAFLNINGYVRSFVIYHQDSQDDFPECAWFGAALPLQPGSETWMFKNLKTIPYSNLTTTQETNAFDKACNTYEYVGGVGITQQGTVAQGEYIDIIRGVDWLTSTIQSYVYSVLVNNPKVPYTDAGIAQIEGEVRRALQLGVDNNFIAADPAYTISVPRASAVAPIDKTNRILKNVRFQATLAGAIHATQITGTVSV